MWDAHPRDRSGRNKVRGGVNSPSPSLSPTNKNANKEVNIDDEIDIDIAAGRSSPPKDNVISSVQEKPHLAPNHHQIPREIPSKLMSDY